MPQRDSWQYTFIVALVLCLVCSAVVSIAAVALESTQKANKELDKKKNVLLAAGFGDEIESSADVDRIFDERIQKEFINISSGEVLSEEQLAEMGIDPKAYDAKKAANDPDLQVDIPAGELPGISDREPVAEVYEIRDGEKISGYVFPIYGKGLWSTLYGFLAIESDKQTVRGITYYSHAETPGLGGEVDNPGWKDLWKGKKVYEQDGEVGLSVLKGKAAPDDQYAVDGLSGATLTTKGVDNMIHYWLGPDAYGNYLQKH